MPAWHLGSTWSGSSCRLRTLGESELRIIKKGELPQSDCWSGRAHFWLFVSKDELLRKAFFIVPPETSMLGAPGAMGGWFETGAERQSDLLISPNRVGTTKENPSQGATAESLRDTALKALWSRGINVSTGHGGAIVTIDPNRSSPSIRVLLRYRPSWTPISAHFNELRVELTKLIPVNGIGRTEG
jgi:hypothetical protein